MQFIRFRPHHLLCSRFFEGHGYSKEFTDNMENILNSIDNHTEIEIVKGKDDLCSYCPNYINDNCTSYIKVDKYDELVLNELNLKYGNKLNYQSFIKTYNPSKMINRICADCEWFTICKKHK